MKVQEYRDQIDCLVQAYNSLLSAVNSQEKFRESLWVEKELRLLESCDCKTAKPKDRERAAYWIKTCRDRLQSTGLQQLIDQHRAADANLQKQAFAGEYR